MAKYNIKFNHTITVFKALSDENRLRAFLALQAKELCVCQIIALLGLAPSTVSKHMSILKNAGVVETKKKGRWVYYRITDYENSGVEQILKALPDILTNEQQIKEDAEKINRILSIDPEYLCKLQNEMAENVCLDELVSRCAEESSSNRNCK